MKKRIFILLVVPLFVAGCNGFIWESSIPERAVYVERTLLTEAFELLSVGGYKTITKDNKKINESVGFAGILLFHGYNDEYFAFDLACPYELNENVKVEPNTMGQAVCPICGSVYSLGWGTGALQSGVAKEGLKKYRVIYLYLASGDKIRELR